MRYADLIASAAAGLVQTHEGALGVRLSPCDLLPSDAKGLVRASKRALGRGVHLALSIPDAEERSESQICVYPDERAAERATDWRNTVQVSHEERILYISAREHGKAGGLTDCLLPLEREHLIETFISWCEEESGLPDRLPELLIEANVTAYASPRSLCNFAKKAARAQQKSKAWEAVGTSLSELLLATDSKLRGVNADRRLLGNRHLVSIASTGEDRRTKNLGEEVQAALTGIRAALRVAPDERVSALRKVDLGEISTNALAQVVPKGSRQKKSKPSKPKPSAADKKKIKRGPGKKKTKRGAGKRKAEDTQGPQSGNATTVPATATAVPNIAADLAGRSKTTPKELTAIAQVLHATASGRTPKAPRPRPPGPGTAPSNSDGAEGSPPPQPPQPRLRVSAPRLEVPPGLEVLLYELLEGEGEGLSWQTSSDRVRDWFAKLPKRRPDPERIAPTAQETGEFSKSLRSWKHARAEAREAILGEGDRREGALVFLRTPLIALSRPGVLEKAEALVAAVETLYEAAGSAHVDQQLATLALDTLKLTGGAGEDEAVILGPLHGLWLGQAAEQLRALTTQVDLDELSQRLLVRSLTQAPAAPQYWPVDRAQELELSQPLGGLVCYERRARSISDGDALALGQGLVERYLELYPYARLALRVAVQGRDVEALLQGLQEGAATSGARLEAYVGSTALRWTGDLELNSLPIDPSKIGEEVDPHLLVTVDPYTSDPRDLEDAAPTPTHKSGGGGLLTTRFSMIGDSLRAETPLADTPVLRQLEALHARCRGRLPQEAFVATSRAVSLGAACREGLGGPVWEVVIGRRIGRVPPQGSFLLLHQTLSSGAQVAVITRNVSPPSRALYSTLSALGVEDHREGVVTRLGELLSGWGPSGLISLSGSVAPLVSAGLLGIALKQELGEGPVVVAPVRGVAYGALLGEEERGDPNGAVLIGAGEAEDGALRLVAGYAAITDPLPGQRRRGELRGPLAERLQDLVRALTRADRDGTLAGAATREVINWVLWPALAAGRGGATELPRVLATLGQGSAKVSVLLLLPSGSPLTRGSRTPTLEGSLVTVRSVDSELINDFFMSAAY